MVNKKIEISRIEISNIRNIEKADITLGDPITSIIGPNGAGKTTILAAIETVLRGGNQWTDAGRPLSDMIRHNARTGKIALHGKNVVEMTIRKRSTELASIKGDKKKKITRQELTEFLGHNIHTLRAVFQTGNFIDLPEKEQAEMLLDLIGDELPEEEVMKELDELIPESTIKELREDAPEELFRSAQGLRELYDIAYNRRTGAKKALAGNRTKLEAIRPPGEVNELDKTVVEKRHQGAIKKLNEVASSLAKANAAIQERKRVTARREQLIKELKGAEGFVKLDVDLAPLEKAKKGHEAKAKLATDALNDLVQKGMAINASLSKVQYEIVDTEKALDAFGVTKFDCPVFEINCPAVGTEPLMSKKSVISEGLNVLEQERKRLHGEHEKLTLEHEKKRALVDSIAAKILVVHGEFKEANKKREENQRILGQAEALRQELARIDKQLESGVVDKSVLEKLSEEHKKAAKEVRDVDDLVSALHRMNEIHEVEAFVAKQKAEVEGLEKAVKALAPDSIPKTLLLRRAGWIKSIARTRSNMLSGENWQLEITDDMEFYVHFKSGPVVHVKSLSESEKARVGIVIQDVLSQLAGLGILVVDSLEKYEADPDSRKAVRETINAIVDDHSTILLAQTGSSSTPMPGKTYVIRSGIAGELAQTSS